MEEDAGVKAPVTRLRRRLSVEQTEESKSPAINTPTKKRGGRRAKPDLELIEENTPENTKSKRTKKTAVKEVIDTVEEKVITPSRRTTRIKSNTSIVSESALAVGSPRAKRAARRGSQVGSDSEAPPTPIRQSRRTRKDSASSVETAETLPLSKPALQITEVIVEEPENNGRKSTNNSEKEDNSSPSSTRKSPRLANKKSTQNDNEDPSTKAAKEESQNLSLKKTKSKKSIDSSLPSNEEISETKLSKKDKKEHISELSTSAINLIKDLDVVVTKLKIENLNKSASTIKKQDKEKLKRTKSWTTLTVSNESNYYSDNEFSIKKIGEKIDLLPLNKSGSGDAETSIQDTSDISFSKSKKKDVKNLVEKNNDSVNMRRRESIKKKNNDNINSPSLTSENNMSELFEKEPSEHIQTIVFIEEDSDSNAGKTTQKRHNNEDQCVPVVKHPDEITKIDNQLNLTSSEKDNHLNKSKEKSLVNNSCEPMDVDETIPESLLLEMQSSEVGSPKRNSISKFSQESNISRKESLNKSERKSSISHHHPENSKNENKSTLVLSQLKDSSSNDFNIEAKSPQIKNILSKTSEILNITQENEIKKNISLNCVTTSTPLQQKNIQKIALQVNTSSITANENSNDMEDSEKQKTKNITVIDDENSSDESDSKVPDPGSSKKGAELSENNIEPKTKDYNNDKLYEENERHEKSIDKGNVTRNNTRHSDNSSKSDNETLNNDRECSVENSSKSSKIKKNMSITFEDEVESVNNSSDEIESDDEVRETNSLLDDKAIDAGVDYSSGDSQDQSEREYEQQNQILEKGETLTSDEDFSDDTDYEKDSFVVSSAEEDNDLLDGSEDDLSMSDNELKMTAKSKKKFNERKLKEQKKASKEMYDARHKLNTSKSNIKTKRNKRQQLASSESEDESEIESGLTRPNKMRLDSTNEDSMLDDITEKKINKKKTKRLSESMCEENINEMEISITNKSLKESDPLSTDIKVEPKTPQKINSSIAFINSDDNNDDDKNELTKTQTEIIDPLDDSSDSDTVNIMQNYDSILENLIKTNKRKPKTCDTSLNLDKKIKKQKTALVDELNLTQLKSAQKNKNKNTKEKICPKKGNQEAEDSSDSIDLHLLFSEDSNNSEDVIDKKLDKGIEEEFIPLKRTDARTNIREDEDNHIQPGNTSLNGSLKKNKKRKSNTEESINSSETETNGVSFFIDTKGSHVLMNKPNIISLNESHNISLNKSRNISLNKSHNISLNKSHNTSLNNKKKFEEDDELDSSDSEEAPSHKTNLSLNKFNKSLSQTPASAKKDSSKVEIKISPANDSDSDAPVEVSFVKEKRNTEVPDTDAIVEDITDSVVDKSINKSKAATPVSEKKKKKKAKDVEVTEPEDIEAPAETSLNVSLSSGKKKKNKQSRGTPAKELDNAANVSLNVSMSKKKNKSINETLDTSKSEIETVNISKIKTPNSHKKAKEAVQDESVENSEDMNTNSKKRKRNPSLNISIENIQIEQGADNNTSKDINESIVSSQKKKRKTSQQKGNNSAVEQTHEDNILTYSDKKETKNQSQCSNQDEVPAENTKRKRNKRKEREDDEDIATTKVPKNSFDIHIPRLPAGILSQLDEKPNRSNIAKKARVISTTQFLVEESIKRKNKPSNYLEESVYLDDDETEKKKLKKRLLKPKVLPFVPTAITSDTGYTTNFKVNVIPKDVKFVAQSSNISNFKNEFLYKNKVRRQGTYELYKKNRTVKISKF